MNSKYIAMRSEASLESLPVDPSLLERANWWFDISWYGLLWAGAATALAACATVTFLFIQFWSSGIRERHSDWRTSSLEVQTKRAEADLALAKADIANADARAAEANQKAAEAQLALERFKAPRWITDVQLGVLVPLLKHFQGISADIWLIHAPSSDAAPLAARLLSVLKSAEWNANGVFNLMGGMSGTGILIATRDNPDPNDLQAATALLSELNTLGLAANLGKGVTDNPVNTLGAHTGPSPSKPPANLWIIVGSKP
jgi:hypothetical protein